MPQPLSNESKELLRLLADGQWHDLATVRTELRARVPPGRALRNWETKEAAREAKTGPRKKNLNVPMDERIRIGQNTLAGYALHSMAKRYLEFDVDTPVMADRRRVRLRPGALESLGEAKTPPPSDSDGGGDGPPPPSRPPAPDTTDPQQPPICERCGLVIGDTAQHEQFHREFAGPPAVAFFHERQMRELFADEVANEVAIALDRFGAGLYEYLERQFANVDARFFHQLRRGPASGSARRFGRL